MRFLAAVFAPILVCIGGLPAHAQESQPPSVIVGVGAAGSLHAEPGQSTYAPYAELGVYLPLYLARDAGLILGGGLYIGGWTDEMTSPSSCADCITYARSSGMIGFKAGATFDRMPIPLTLWLGGSEHIIRYEYARGAGVDGTIGKDHWRTYAAVASGITIDVPVGRATGIILDVGWHVPVLHADNTQTPVRVKGSLGVSYTL